MCIASLAAEEKRSRTGGDLSHQLGGVRAPQPSNELGKALFDEWTDLRPSELTRRVNRRQSSTSSRAIRTESTRLLAEVSLDAIEPAEAVRGALWDLERRIDVVEVPTQPLLNAGALPYLVLPAVEELLDVPLDAFELSSPQRRLSARMSDRKVMDTV